jgi:hypothetical protein
MPGTRKPEAGQKTAILPEYFAVGWMDESKNQGAAAESLEHGGCCVATKARSHTSSC